MSNPLNYTIGWICATENGFIAAQAFLDKTHPRHSPLSKIDTNTYVLGSMGNHNVVITVLPLGKADAVNAARTGTLLRRSFVNVEVALLIGTAGGAPTERNDIRLGDVVVSFPGHGHTGVFQWDFGKAIQGQPFLNTRVLNPPPEILLQAASKLEAHYEKNGHQLQQYIDTVLLAYPKLRKGGYDRPENSSDRLSLSEVVPPAGDDFGCAESCENNAAILGQRSPRTGRDSDPCIHHGLIASGNTFVDRAKFRDEIVAKNGVLCFEKNAAGLMNTLPCMAICGISNYADIHVNKEWEAYAAMTATAYAKDLLQCVPPFNIDTMTGPESDESCVERWGLARLRRAEITLDCRQNMMLIIWSHGDGRHDVNHRQIPFHNNIHNQSQLPSKPHISQLIIVITQRSDTPKMVIQYQGAQIPISFASCSIPMKIKASLPDKLNAICQAGFDGIELSMPDIVSYGELLSGSVPKEDDYDTLADVGKQIKSLTDELGLKIMMLQPFANFEGWKKGTHDKERQQAFDKARGWMKIMDAAGITLLQVGSSDSEGISSSFDDLASDLAELADLLAEKNYSIAYENWCWATHAPTWKDVWQIVQKTNRPNIGLCLDTFQTAGYEWGDPTTKDGLTISSSSEQRQKRWEESLKELASTVPADKIYLLQISDAYKMDPPIEDVKDDSGARPRARWSHDYRPLPCDGGYLPVQDMVAAVLKTGFRSWLSVEVFDGLEGENTDMNEYTKEAVESVKKLINLGD